MIGGDSIVITGATGTFGQEFVRSSLASSRWRRVICFSRDEVKQSQLYDRFGHEPSLRMFLGDVRDDARLRIAFCGVHTVIHAAALKRVDAGAYSPSETIRTNIEGTINVVHAAIAAGVKRVVVISSDKACLPTNIYGYTKGCGEMYAVHANAYAQTAGTRIAAVRYGNVIGSRGSVVHLWRQQVSEGRPATITSPKMTRFIMTIEQAVELVWYAHEAMHGGEVFIPVLPTATMTDLATAVLPKDWPQTVIGLRPGGEKYAEVLINDEEASRAYRTNCGRFIVVVPSHHHWTSGDAWIHDAGGRWLPQGYKLASNCETATRLGVEALRSIIRDTVTC